jgi:hypothetical protein
MVSLVGPGSPETFGGKRSSLVKTILRTGRAPDFTRFAAFAILCVKEGTEMQGFLETWQRVKVHFCMTSFSCISGTRRSPEEHVQEDPRDSPGNRAFPLLTCVSFFLLSIGYPPRYHVMVIELATLARAWRTIRFAHARWA